MIQIAVFGATVSYILMMVSHIMLRRREPELDRPYRTPGGVATTGVALVLACAALVAVFLVDVTAAIITLIVFLAFLAAPDVFLKLFGVGLASAILLDATLVRMVLVPAVMQLLGRRNWWIPDWLDRRLPRLDVELVALGGAEGRP